MSPPTQPDGARDLSRLAFRLSAGIPVLWGIWALVYTVIEHGLNYGAFGFISPVVGLVLLVVSLAGLRQAIRRNASTRSAIAAIVLSVAVGVLPFAALVSGLACDRPCYT